MGSGEGLGGKEGGGNHGMDVINENKFLKIQKGKQTFLLPLDTNHLQIATHLGDFEFSYINNSK